MKWSDILTLAVAIAGVGAGVWAAVFAQRADTFGRDRAKTADRQRDREIQPRPRERWLGFPDTPGGSFAVYNIGGAAAHLVFVGTGRGSGQPGRRLYVGFGHIPGDFIEYLPLGTEDLGPLPESAAFGEAEVLLLFAEDLDGRWWDCKAGQLLAGAGRDGVVNRLETLGLKDFAGRVLQVAKLDS